MLEDDNKLPPPSGLLAMRMPEDGHKLRETPSRRTHGSSRVKVLRGVLAAVLAILAQGTQAASGSPSHGVARRLVQASAPGSVAPPVLSVAPGPVPGTVPPPNLFPGYELFPVCLNVTEGSVNLTISGGALSRTKWKGWGTSLAWFANYIGRLPKEHLSLLLDLVFDKDKGLGLNIVRYNIGGGYNPQISTQFNASGPQGFYGIPGFRQSPSTGYDWSADSAQRAVMLGARDRGADTFVAFSNSPPWWMTRSGDVAGANIPYTSNINRSYYSAFADYLTEVVKQYAANPAWNITFDSLEPFNEAVEGPWTRGYDQEGCHMDMQDIAAIIPLVSASLKSKGLRTKLVGIDSWAEFTVPVLDALNASVRSLLQRYDVHAYWFPRLTALDSASAAASLEASFLGVRLMARRDRREVWQTEWCALWRMTGADMDLALVLARTVMESVNILEASAWVYWQALEGSPVAWSLIDIPWNYSVPFSYSMKKNYWVLKHFTSHILPGSFAITVTTSQNCHHCVVGFYDRRHQLLNIFIVNQQAADFNLTLLLSSFKGTGATNIQAYRTSYSENHSLVFQKMVSPLPTLAVVVRGQSLTSLHLWPLTNVTSM